MRIELENCRGMTLDAEFEDGIWEIAGKPSSGKTVLRHGICDWLIDHYADVDVDHWPNRQADQERAIRYLCGTEKNLQAACEWFSVKVLRAAVEHCWDRYQNVLSRSVPHAPNSSILKIIKERLQMALNRAERSLEEISYSTFSPLSEEELIEEGTRIRSQIKKLQSLEQDLDSQGRHEDAVATFESRIEMQARFRQVESDILLKQNKLTLEMKEEQLEVDISLCRKGLEDVEKLVTGLAGASKRMEIELLGQIKQRARLDVAVSPGGQLMFDRPWDHLSDTERAGVRSAVSVALKLVTGFPVCFLEGSPGERVYDV